MFQLSPTPASAEHRQKQGSAHLYAAHAQPGINVSLPGAGGMGTDIRVGTCGWPEPLLSYSVICLLTSLAILCSPLLCAPFVLLVVNLLPNHLRASALAQTAQTLRHRGTCCRKWERGQGWLGCHVGPWILHPMARPMHHVGSTNSPSPLSPHSKTAPASLGPVKDSPRS